MGNSMTIRCKPLSGVRVLDLTQLLPGPMCTLHLADMGAEVIKIESPKGGDPVRGHDGSGFSPMFLMLNRNKRSLALNLRTAEGAGVLRRLARDADVLVEGFRPGVLDRLGLGSDSLRAENPKLVVCSITGYGQDGPLSQAAGHDLNYQAIAGVLDQSGEMGRGPAQGNFPIADLAGGSLSAAMGILAALFDAQRTGRGRHVDIAMTDCVMAHNIMATSAYNSSGHSPPRGMDYLSGGLACYGCYRTSDGRYLAIGAIEMKFWKAVCDTLGRRDLYDKGHLGGRAGQVARAEIAAEIARRTLREWLAAFDGVDACVTPVLRIDEAVDHPQIAARGMAVRASHDALDDYVQYACPLRMSGFEFGIGRPPPALGADDVELLAEAGYDDAAIDALRRAGALREPG